MIKGVNHIGISVANLERATRFYCDLLDMEIVIGEARFGGEIYEQILGLVGAKGRVSLLKNGSLQLELFEFSHPSPRRQDAGHPVSDHGLSHFCIEVADIDEVYERLRNSGVSFHCPPIEFLGKARATYGRDPDGNVFELLELSGVPSTSETS